MNSELLKGLDLTINGLLTIKKALLAEGEPVSADSEPADTSAVEVSTAPANEGTTYSRSELEKMPYNKFKTLAAKLGVKCTGTRDDILTRIEKLGVVVDDAAAEEALAEEDTAPAPAPEKKGRMKKTTSATKGKKEEVPPPPPAPKSSKSDKPVGGKRGLSKKATEPAGDEFDQQAKEILDDTPVEDVLAALADVNVKATKKNVAEKLAYALREGLIEVEPDDEDEDDTAAEEEDVESDTEEESEDDSDEGDDTDYHPEYDPKGYNDPSALTMARRDAIETMVDEVQTDFSEGRLTTEDITKFLEENCTQDELDLLEDSDDEDALLALYIEMKKRFIDDEGDTHETEDPYEVNTKDVCCAHQLKYLGKSKKYVCEMCGGEYEAE